ncbi:hypothetical protein JHK84_037067 [Glycine max]|nr:hypothetical protein JHK84_037067 [Glycine max]
MAEYSYYTQISGFSPSPCSTSTTFAIYSIQSTTVWSEVEKEKVLVMEVEYEMSEDVLRRRCSW